MGNNSSTGNIEEAFRSQVKCLGNLSIGEVAFVAAIALAVTIALHLAGKYLAIWAHHTSRKNAPHDKPPADWRDNLEQTSEDEP